MEDVNQVMMELLRLYLRYAGVRESAFGHALLEGEPDLLDLHLRMLPVPHRRPSEKWILDGREEMETGVLPYSRDALALLMRAYRALGRREPEQEEERRWLFHLTRRALYWLKREDAAFDTLSSLPREVDTGATRFYRLRHPECGPRLLVGGDEVTPPALAVEVARRREEHREKQLRADRSLLLEVLPAEAISLVLRSLLEMEANSIYSQWISSSRGKPARSMAREEQMRESSQRVAMRRTLLQISLVNREFRELARAHLMREELLACSPMDPLRFRAVSCLSSSPQQQPGREYEEEAEERASKHYDGAQAERWARESTFDLEDTDKNPRLHTPEEAAGSRCKRILWSLLFFSSEKEGKISEEVRAQRIRRWKLAPDEGEGIESLARYLTGNELWWLAQVNRRMWHIMRRYWWSDCIEGNDVEPLVMRPCSLYQVLYNRGDADSCGFEGPLVYSTTLPDGTLLRRFALLHSKGEEDPAEQWDDFRESVGNSVHLVDPTCTLRALHVYSPRGGSEPYNWRTRTLTYASAASYGEMCHFFDARLAVEKDVASDEGEVTLAVENLLARRSVAARRLMEVARNHQTWSRCEGYVHMRWRNHVWEMSPRHLTRIQWGTGHRRCVILTTQSHVDDVPAPNPEKPNLPKLPCYPLVLHGNPSNHYLTCLYEPTRTGVPYSCSRLYECMGGRLLVKTVPPEVKYVEASRTYAKHEPYEPPNSVVDYDNTVLLKIYPDQQVHSLLAMVELDDELTQCFYPTSEHCFLLREQQGRYLTFPPSRPQSRQFNLLLVDKTSLRPSGLLCLGMKTIRCEDPPGIVELPEFSRYNLHEEGVGLHVWEVHTFSPSKADVGISRAEYAAKSFPERFTILRNLKNCETSPGGADMEDLHTDFSTRVAKRTHGMLLDNFARMLANA
jgi:hypothetical protein